jgi:hypothetical protein
MKNAAVAVSRVAGDGFSGDVEEIADHDPDLRQSRWPHVAVAVVHDPFDADDGAEGRTADGSTISVRVPSPTKAW